MKNHSTILVVDDEITMCLVLKRVLKKAGYGVGVAVDGTEALNYIREKKPDAVLLDLMMPGMNGREICQRIRIISPSTRIIYFTAKVELDLQKLKELRREADTLISKPATSKAILSGVSSVLNRAS
jgi:two-component system alkaline phosphatase synthesis response regulator PhoP